MQISQAGLQFIRNQEGCVLHVYNDVAGYPTIGIGHKLKLGESYPNGITESQALGLLATDVGIVENRLNALIPPDCTQNQFDALMDFGFECGTQGLQTMLSHGWDQVPQQMPRWIYAGGEVVEGMVKRRAADVALFNS